MLAQLCRSPTGRRGLTQDLAFFWEHIPAVFVNARGRLPEDRRRSLSFAALDIPTCFHTDLHTHLLFTKPKAARKAVRQFSQLPRSVQMIVEECLSPEQHEKLQAVREQTTLVPSQHCVGYAQEACVFGVRGRKAQATGFHRCLFCDTDRLEEHMVDNRKSAFVLMSLSRLAPDIQNKVIDERLRPKWREETRRR